MPRPLYTLLLRLLLPLAVPWALWRNWRDGGGRGALRDMLALRNVARSDRPLWLHAASVGEVQALAALVRGANRKATPLLLTVSTATGLSHAREIYRDLLLPVDGPPRLAVQMAPWDLPGAANRFLRANRPRAAVYIETELWPNLIKACARARIPQVLVSARMSKRSLYRYQRYAPALMRETVRSLAIIATQTEVDSGRFIALGARPARVTVNGNLKFDLPLPPDITLRASQQRAGWARNRPLWVAGSTHAEEETAVVDAHRELLERARGSGAPLPLLVLAPRRPERFASVAQWLSKRGVKMARVSQMGKGSIEGLEVLLVDVMGELLYWYAAADVAFVGGSLVPVGGHNLLEPAALGKPVLAGPHCFNSPETATLLRAAEAMKTVTNAAELAQALQRLLGDAALAQAVGARAADVVTANRGAAKRALAMLATLPSRD